MALIQWNRVYRVASMRVASYDESTGQWGGSVQVIGVNGFSITPNHDTDTANVNGAVGAMLSVLTSLGVALDTVGIDVPSYTIMTSADTRTSGSGANEAREIDFEGGKDLAPFGAIVQLTTQGGGDLHIKLPWGKLDNIPELSTTAENSFAVPSTPITFGQLIDPATGDYYLVGQLVQYAECKPIETDFNVAFAPLLRQAGC